MAQKDRLEEISRLVRLEGKVVVTELSERFGVTPEMIRRDLERLENEKLITRVHGGAVLKSAEAPVKINFLRREKTNVEEKRIIARIASQQIPLNASIGCDASSTCMELLRMLGKRSDILVLTNSAKAICEMDNSAFELLSTGGYANRQSYSMQGGAARAMIKGYYLERVFIGCKGLDLSGGIFDSHSVEIEIKQALMEQGSKIYLLADHSKFGGNGFIRLADIHQIDVVITDRRPPDEWVRFFEMNNVELICGEDNQTN